MVFEPTFDKMDEDAAALPDLEGADPAADRDEVDGGLADGPDSADEAQDDVVEGEAEAALVDGDVTANDLPPEGA